MKISVSFKPSIRFHLPSSFISHTNSCGGDNVISCESMSAIATSDGDMNTLPVCPLPTPITKPPFPLPANDSPLIADQASSLRTPMVTSSQQAPRAFPVILQGCEYLGSQCKQVHERKSVPKKHPRQLYIYNFQ